MMNIIPDNYLHVNIIIVSYLPYHFAQCATLCCLTELAEFFYISGFVLLNNVIKCKVLCNLSVSHTCDIT